MNYSIQMRLEKISELIFQTFRLFMKTRNRIYGLQHSEMELLNYCFPQRHFNTMTFYILPKTMVLVTNSQKLFMPITKEIFGLEPMEQVSYNLLIIASLFILTPHLR